MTARRLQKDQNVLVQLRGANLSPTPSQPIQTQFYMFGIIYTLLLLFIILPINSYFAY